MRENDQARVAAQGALTAAKAIVSDLQQVQGEVGDNEVIAQACEVAAEALMAAHGVSRGRIGNQMSLGMASQAAYCLELAEMFREWERAGTRAGRITPWERECLLDRLRRVMDRARRILNEWVTRPGTR